MKHNQNDKVNEGGFDAPKTPVRRAAENIIEGANQEDQLEQMKKQAEKDSAIQRSHMKLVHLQTRAGSQNQENK